MRTKVSIEQKLDFVAAALKFDSDQCLIWPYGINPRGYPFLTSKLNAHRHICFIVNGSHPEGKREAAHTCGNRTCVNPRHIQWKSRAENEADKFLHGTHNRGERCGAAKLTAEQVIQIRIELGAGESITTLAKAYGVSRGAIYLIRSGKNWSHI